MSNSRTRTKNRNTELGDRASFCVDCGWARRYYPGVVEAATQCPACDGTVIDACPACGVDILSVMAVECDECGSSLREPEANGVRIHRPKRLPMARADQAADADTAPAAVRPDARPWVMPLVLGLRYPLAGLRALRKPSIGVLDETRLSMRVRPSDCDVLMHVNNGRYLSLMDIGRIDLVTRAGWMPVLRKQGWGAVAGGVTIRFRRELRLGARYELVTRCVGWDDSWWFFEQRFEREDGTLAARAYAKVTILDKGKRRVPAARVLQALDVDVASPQLPTGIAAWQSSEFG